MSNRKKNVLLGVLFFVLWFILFPQSFDNKENLNPSFFVLSLISFVISVVFFVKAIKSKKTLPVDKTQDKGKYYNVKEENTIDIDSQNSGQNTSRENVLVKRKKKRVLVFVIGLLSFFAIIGIIMSATMDSVKTGIAYYIDVTTEQGKEIDNTLKECGIEKLESAEHDELLDNANEEGETGYRLSTENAKNIILYLNSKKKVNSIKYGIHDLYKDDNVISSLKDYTITLREASDLQFMCQEKIKEILKSPSTAKFPNILEWPMSKDKNIVIVQSYVDSQNGFGAEVRSKFQFTIDTEANTINSLIFDGEELVK